ncbi:MAG: PD-(D/E)XK nuclease domain-containing protein [Firmicutes bacterium]|uniref:PD-(D/E)XK nuclease domain-containing protein n=1 Tax=Candidatus Onthovivens merdipullorum TaxID=2840889 RepID=A0A9D9DIU7_9BACL|nr:PD-(D/E)XK nuclease domain-containing protein [Candidatus Onthovivens merdipullorum]
MGLGRSDISISPKKGNDNSFIFELKYVKEGSERSLKTLANKAIKQIKEKEYYKEMLNKKIKKVTLFGFAFSKNKVKVVSEIIESKFKVKEF